MAQLSQEAEQMIYDCVKAQSEQNNIGKRVPGSVAVTFRDEIFPKDIKQFAQSKNLSIDDPGNRLTQPIIGRVTIVERKPPDIQQQQSELRKLFSLAGIDKITVTGIRMTNPVTGEDLTTDVRQTNPGSFSVSSRFTILFTGSESTVRSTILKNVSGIHVVDREYLIPHLQEKTNSRQIVVQFGHQRVFTTLRDLTERFRNEIPAIYLLGGDVMQIHFSSELNRKDISDILIAVRIQENEFSGFDNTYEFQEVFFTVPIGEENMWVRLLNKETAHVKSARLHQIVAPYDQP